MRDSVLLSLRIAAALSHRLSFGVRLSHEGRVHFRVGFVPGDAGMEAPCVPPCAFRVNVADAWRQQRLGRGRGLAICGMPDGADPVIELDPPRGGAVWPGGVYEVPLRDQLLYAFPTTAGLAQCHEAACPADLDLHVDPLLGVTLLLRGATNDHSSRAEARETLLDAAACLVVAEVLDEAGADVSP